jgi:hypothetical protein
MTRKEFIEKFSGKHYGDAKSLENKLAEVAGAIYDTMFKFIEDTPVDGVKAIVTVDMTNNNADLTYTAREYGTDGDDITVTHVNPDENDEDLVVTVDGKDITVSLETGSTGDIASTANDVKAAIEAHEEADALVAVTADGDGTGAVVEKGEESLSGGVNVTEGIVGSAAFDETNFYVKVDEQEWREVAHDSV